MNLIFQNYFSRDTERFYLSKFNFLGNFFSYINYNAVSQIYLRTKRTRTKNHELSIDSED